MSHNNDPTPRKEGNISQVLGVGTFLEAEETNGSSMRFFLAFSTLRPI